MQDESVSSSKGSVKDNRLDQSRKEHINSRNSQKMVGYQKNLLRMKFSIFIVRKPRRRVSRVRFSRCVEDLEIVHGQSSSPPSMSRSQMLGIYEIT